MHEVQIDLQSTIVCVCVFFFLCVSERERARKGVTGEVFRGGGLIATAASVTVHRTLQQKRVTSKVGGNNGGYNTHSKQY